MNRERPKWYLTPKEFAELVVESLETTNHFKQNERVHPEDLVIAFVTQAEAIAIGAGAVGRKMHGKKNAVMETGNLSKYLPPPATAETGSISDEELGYSEYRHKNAYM